MKNLIENFLAKCVCKGIELYIRKQRYKITNVLKGDEFLCIKDVIMNDDSEEISYFQGEIYLSENDGCITDEYGDKSHWWIKEEEINSYFKKIQP